jgi:hypothetical protein
MASKVSRGSNAFNLSLDTWAVILALALALAVRVGVFHKIPW